eukprot:COSAG04_NODE_4778_length_1898_cov_1.442468_4_plen_115_part_00
MEVVERGTPAEARPTLLVVLFHGLTGWGEQLATDFEALVAQHPTARFLFPSSPKAAPPSDWNKSGKGRDWFLLEGRDVIEVIEERVAALNSWLDEQLARPHPIPKLTPHQPAAA